MGPVGVLAIDRAGDFPELHILPDPPIWVGDCTLGYCNLANVLSADFDHEIAALVVDPRVCGPDEEAQLSYHWTITYPAGAGQNQAVFAPQGITGYHDSVLRIAEQTMPNLDVQEVSDPYWRASLEITLLPHTDFPMTPEPITTTHRFRFRYTDASHSIAEATTCQGPFPESCEVDNFRRPPEGTY